MLQHFSRIASDLPVEHLLGALDRQPELWNEITARQETPGYPHHDTETIFLRWCQDQSVEAAFSELIAVDYPALQKLPEARALIATVMKHTGATHLGRVIITRLHPDGFIDPHSDEGKYADRYERFHIALDSEEGNLFFAGEPMREGEFVHMLPGEAWWFNHKAKHWVMNTTERPRVHLIIDAVAPDYRKERE